MLVGTRIYKKRGLKLKSDKRGQITLFVVLGLVLLILSGILIGVKMRLQSDKPPIDKLILESSNEKQIYNFVTTCLSSVSREAIEKVGITGGNIYMEGLTASPIPTDSDVLVFAPLKIPYWNYLKECDQSFIGCLSSNKPPLCKPGRPCTVTESVGHNSIEEQMSRYIEENLNYCTNYFRHFENQVLVKEEDDPEVDAIIGDGEISFYLNYPLELTDFSTDNKASLSEFSAEWDVNLKEVYELADEMIEAEREQAFLEKITLNLITAFSDIDSSKLPPTSRMTIKGGGKEFWMRTEVEDLLNYDVLPYNSFIQFQNVNNYNPIFANLTKEYGIYEDGFWSLFDILISNSSDYYPHLSMETIYTYLPIYLKIGDSEIIQPTSADIGDNFMLQTLNFLVNDYRFKYDLSYPLLFTINQENAFSGDGFEFSFAVEANIRQNRAVDKGLAPIQITRPFLTSLDSATQLVNKTIIIETRDRHTGESLEGVSISYYCGFVFELGNTIMKSDKAVFEGKMPFCQFGGKILFEKMGYLGDYLDYNNWEQGNDEFFTFELWPVAEKKINILKRTSENIENIEGAGEGAIIMYETEATELNLTEKVIFNLERQKNSSFEGDVPLVGFLLFRPENGSLAMNQDSQRENIETLYDEGMINDSLRQEYLSALEQQTDLTLPEQNNIMEFVPGTYDVEAHLIYEGNISIPSDTKNICESTCTFGDFNEWGECSGYCGLTGDTETLELEEKSMSSWMSGGAILNFTLTEEQTYNEKDLIFYVLEMSIPESWDDMIKIKSIDEYQEDKIHYIVPLI